MSATQPQNSTVANKLGIKDIAFVAYGVKDMKNAKAFYEGILGLTPSEAFGDMWQEYNIGHGTLAIIAAPEEMTPEYYRGRGFALALEVADLDKAFALIKDAGVKVLQEIGEHPNCKSFVISDPDDNVITLHQLNS